MTSFGHFLLFYLFPKFHNNRTNINSNREKVAFLYGNNFAEIFCVTRSFAAVNLQTNNIYPHYLPVIFCAWIPIYRLMFQRTDTKFFNTSTHLTRIEIKPP